MAACKSSAFAAVEETALSEIEGTHIAIRTPFIPEFLLPQPSLFEILMPYERQS
jgi:hypothetical protein